MKNEVKLLVPAGHWGRIEERARLDEGHEERVWFFDTATRWLAPRGVVLRARAGDRRADATAKLREVGAGLPRVVLERFGAVSGFKLENDCTPESCTPAASLKVGLPEGAEPASAEALELFSNDQLALLQLGGAVVPWSDLCRFGPIRAEVHEDEDAGVDLARWRIGDQELVEVSKKASRPPAEILAELREVLDRWGVPGRGLPGGKTAWALAHLEPR